MKLPKAMVQNLIGAAFLCSVCGICFCQEDDDIYVTPAEQMTITPEGGTYEFTDFQLVVPPGAVSEDTEIEMRKVGSEELLPFFEKRQVSIENSYACIEGEPDGLTFNVPVELIIPVEIEAGEYPVLYDVDLSTGEFTPALTPIVARPETDTLSIFLDHFSVSSAEQIAENKRGEEYCAENPCSCGNIKTQSSDNDVMCTGGCQIVETKTTVTYLDCNKVFNATEKRIGNGCTPTLELRVGKSTINTRESTDVTAKVTMGCPSAVASDEDVEFAVTGPAGVDPSSASTGETGEASTTLTAEDEAGTASVTANARIEYYDYYQHVSFDGQEETNLGAAKTADPNDSIDVEIEESDGWTGTATFSRILDNGCWLEEASYSIVFNFTVDTTTGIVSGIGTASQDVSVAITDASFCIGSNLYTTSIENIDAPETLDLVIYGYYHQFDEILEHLTMAIDLDSLPDFYNFDRCEHYEDGTSECWSASSEATREKLSAMSFEDLLLEENTTIGGETDDGLEFFFTYTIDWVITLQQGG